MTIDISIREYKDTDEKEWVYTKALSYLFSDFFDDISQSKDTFDLPVFIDSIELVALCDNKIIGLLDIGIYTKEISQKYETITLSDLSMVSLFSPWYAYRLFSQVLNMTPADYIRRFRLSKSVLMLRDESCKVLDVAMKLGFGSVDGYQRAFFRELGCDPKQYSDTPIPLYLFIPYQATYQSERKKKQMKNVKSVFVQAVDKPARKVIIKRGIRASDYFAYCEEVRCDVWGRLTSIQSINGEPVCLWLPTAFIAPGTFDVIEFPASKYLMFQGEPFPEADYGEAIEQVQAAIAKYDPSIIGYKWNPESPRIQLEPIGSRGYIELLAIK